MQIDLNNAVYVGFWARLLASVLDSIVQTLLLLPIFFLIFGGEFLVNPEITSSPLSSLLQFAMVTAYCLIFWKFKSATPGKIMMGMAIVDAETGGELSNGRLMLRYLGYYVCVLTCLLGFVWIAFDKRKQGLHDKMAKSVVIMIPAKSAPVAP